MADASLVATEVSQPVDTNSAHTADNAEKGDAKTAVPREVNTSTEAAAEMDSSETGADVDMEKPQVQQASENTEEAAAVSEGVPAKMDTDEEARVAAEAEEAQMGEGQRPASAVDAMLDEHSKTSAEMTPEEEQQKQQPTEILAEAKEEHLPAPQNPANEMDHSVEDQQALTTEQQASKMDADMAPETERPEQKTQEAAQAPKAARAPKSGQPPMKRNREVQELRVKADRMQSQAAQAKAATHEVLQEVRKQEEIVREQQEKLRGLQEKLRQKQESEAAAARAAAKALQELELHDLPEARKKPKHAYSIFLKQSNLVISKASKAWLEMSDEQKKVYKELYEEQLKEYNEWANSEEGKAILARRAEALKAQTAGRLNAGAHVAQAPSDLPAEGACELPEASESPTNPTGGDEIVATPSPAKRAGGDKLRATPPKQRRTVAPAQTPQAAPLGLDESICEEASKLSLHAQLINLAGRAEIQALNKPAEELLEALRKHGGMVNAAKRQLLEAGA